MKSEDVKEKKDLDFVYDVDLPGGYRVDWHNKVTRRSDGSLPRPRAVVRNMRDGMENGHYFPFFDVPKPARLEALRICALKEAADG